MRMKVGVLHYQLMVVTVLAESPPLGPMIEETGLFSLGLGNAVAVAAVLVKSVKFRHAVAVGTFVIGSARQHEAIKHLASLRVPPVEGQVGTVWYGLGAVGFGWVGFGRPGFVCMVWYGTVWYSTVRLTVVIFVIDRVRQHEAIKYMPSLRVLLVEEQVGTVWYGPVYMAARYGMAR